MPRNRVPSFSIPKDGPPAPGGGAGPVLSPPGAVEGRLPFPHPSPSVPHDAAILLTPESSTTQPSTSMANPQPTRLPHSAAWPASLSEMAACNIIRPKPGYSLQDPPSVLSFPNVQFPPDGGLNRDNFAVWLFDPQASYSEFSMAHLPFLEAGLESPFNSNIHYDYESLTSRSQLETPPRQFESDEQITEFRRQEVLRFFQHFRTRQPKSEPLIANLVHDSGGDLPALNLEMMRDCLHEYWEHVSPRLPIVHQPTFSCNRCPLLLLMVMIALGSASLRSRDSSGNLSDYGAFADVIITSARFEILTTEEASPPVGLWVAQALLLLEFYEKMYSSRRLHERSHIYHSATLTLLRRGSPLIGRSGSESPPDEPVPVPGPDGQQNSALDPRTWWQRWADTEAMHRVVFAAFCFDITHAAMFGHAADMAPHEIRLPLPCDDNLWTAPKPDDLRNLDSNLRMYGVKPILFLDGLKRALHGKEVRTHSFGRMIIMSGLLSVGWHLSHRETHLKWLDLTPSSSETQDNSRKILLKAFDVWKESFDGAQGAADSSTSASQRGGSNGPIQSAAVLYHLAHISLHVDIIDCQVYAGARRLLGQKVSTRDYANVVSRMKTWATLASTRHAILHAFKLLYRVLVDQRKGERKRPSPGASTLHLPPIESQTYSCRSEPDPHRPWIMYYAALSIWAFVVALSGTHSQAQRPRQLAGLGPVNNYRLVVDYLSRVASMNELGESAAATLGDGLPDLLDCLHRILAEAHSELLKEAHARLKICRDLLVNGQG